MQTNENPAYRKAFIRYLHKGASIELSLKEAVNDQPTTHYIWRTKGDDKVRPSHAANNGKIFAWDRPPETGHPGEDYGCRCTAEPYQQGSSEFANQTIISSVDDLFPSWTNFDLTRHYYLGGGRGVTLSEIGHLQGVINYFFYTLGKYNDVNAQIIDAARKHPSGNFGYYFNKSYGFGPYLYAFGGGVVSGVFLGTVQHRDGMMQIEGNVSYFYDDTFTDPLSLRQNFSGTSDPSDLSWLGLAAEFAGTYFPIKDYWKTSFNAQAKQDEQSSIYRWR